MKLGYPCTNTTLPCTTTRTFRLKSYSEQRLVQTVEHNLACLRQVLEFNAQHGLLFYRICSELVPFASHPVCAFAWQRAFERPLAELGDFMRARQMRISMHPDQFVLINAPDEGVLNNSLRELAYQAEVLELLGLDATAKIQIHVGGVYGDKAQAIARFAERFQRLPTSIARRLVIENDERLFSLADCLNVHAATGVPIVLDVLHHQTYNAGESLAEAARLAGRTWAAADGVPMVDYSSQRVGGRAGHHSATLDPDHFRQCLTEIGGLDLDLMFEVKDKEQSALAAQAILRAAGHLV